MLMSKSIRVLPKFRRGCFSTLLVAAAAIVMVVPAQADSFVVTQTFTFKVGDLLNGAAGFGDNADATFNFLFAPEDGDAQIISASAPTVPAGDNFTTDIGNDGTGSFWFANFTKSAAQTTISYASLTPGIFLNHMFSPTSADPLPNGWGSTTAATLDYAIPTSASFTITLGTNEIGGFSTTNFVVTLIDVPSTSTSAWLVDQNEPNKTTSIAFEFNPVPEPSQAVAFLSLGALLLIGRFRKRT